MSKPKRKRLPSRKSNGLLLKLPLFVILLKKEDKGLFGALTTQEMVDTLKRQLDKFPRTQLPKKGKSKTTFIDSLYPKVVSINDTPALLVRASVSDTNLSDIVVHSNNLESRLDNASKISSEQYYILFYPKIEGNNSEKYVYTWLQVVYEDPVHNTGVATSVAKSIVQTEIEAESFNVKLQSAVADFMKLATVPELRVELMSYSHQEENEFPQFDEYLCEIKASRRVSYSFKNVPTAETIKFLEDKCDNGEVMIKKKAMFGKKEVRVKRERYDDTQVWRESVEQLFNSSYDVTESQVLSGEIYEEEFLIERFTSVITNYLTNQ